MPQCISTQKTSAPNKYAGLLQALEKETCLSNVSVRCPNIPFFQNGVFENRVPRRLDVVIPLSYLLSYRCHTLGVDLESVSVLPILPGCLEHRFAPANVPSKFAPCCHTRCHTLVVIPCCHTRCQALLSYPVYVLRRPSQIGTRPYIITY